MADINGHAKAEGAGKARKGVLARAGVTLVELMLAVAILAVVSVTVMAVFNVGVESWMTGTALADESHNADAVMEQVVMALRSAYYPEGTAPTYEYGFQHADGGDAPKAGDRISWVKVGNSLVGEDTPWAGTAHRVELYVDDVGADGPGLYVKAWQLVGQAEDFDPEEDVVPLLISDKVISLDCRMKDPDKAVVAGEPYEWTDEWTASNRIPTQVLVSIAIKPTREREDPMEYVRCVDMPMAAMSWNVFQAGGGRPGRDPRRQAPGGGSPQGGARDGGAPRTVHIDIGD